MVILILLRILLNNIGFIEWQVYVMLPRINRLFFNLGDFNLILNWLS
jgi:hypothetical protein